MLMYTDIWFQIMWIGLNNYDFDFLPFLSFFLCFFVSFSKALLHVQQTYNLNTYKTFSWSCLNKNQNYHLSVCWTVTCCLSNWNCTDLTCGKPILRVTVQVYNRSLPSVIVSVLALMTLCCITTFYSKQFPFVFFYPFQFEQKSIIVATWELSFCFMDYF